jgi:hypothetical protein
MSTPLTADQKSELTDVFAELIVLHSRVNVVTDAIHANGGIAIKVLMAQMAITDAIGAVADAKNA